MICHTQWRLFWQRIENERKGERLLKCTFRFCFSIHRVRRLALPRFLWRYDSRQNFTSAFDVGSTTFRCSGNEPALTQESRTRGSGGNRAFFRCSVRISFLLSSVSTLAFHNATFFSPRDIPVTQMYSLLGSSRPPRSWARVRDVTSQTDEAALRIFNSKPVSYTFDFRHVFLLFS